MGLFDSIKDAFSGGSGGGIFDSIGDLITLGGQAAGIYADVSAGNDADDIAKKQADEYKRVALANRDISLYDASVAAKDAVAFEQQAAVSTAINIERMDKVLGAARASLGKSGVSVSEGSALDLQRQIIMDAERDISTMIHNGKTGYERRMSASRRYELLADKGLRDAAAHATIIEDAARSEQLGHYWSAAGRGAEFVETLGRSEGWW